MYIADKYWNNYIGDTDDSMTLVDYLADKQKNEITLSEIFSDTGLDKLNGDFRGHEEPLVVNLKNLESDYDEIYVEFYYAMNLITDLAALLLECRVNGSVNLCALYDGVEAVVPEVCITATPEEHALINQTLLDFVSEPQAFDVSEVNSEEDLQAATEVCAKLRAELYG